MCSLWKCGTRTKPTRHATFYDSFDTVELVPSSFSLDYTPCSTCFGRKKLEKYNWHDFIPDKDVLNGVAVDSDAESLSSACSSDSSESL